MSRIAAPLLYEKHLNIIRPLLPLEKHDKPECFFQDKKIEDVL